MTDPGELNASGWTSVEAAGFTGQLGPLWVRGAGGTREIGFFAAPHHGNSHLGTVHGGLLMIFADIGLGYGAADALGGQHCATAQLQIQFVATANLGDFLTCRPELVRAGSRLLFMRGLIKAGDKTVASADGIWKVLDRQLR
jgi:acyl-coenzyme A thioesterase PaaI-like protein